MKDISHKLHALSSVFPIMLFIFCFCYDKDFLIGFTKNM